MELCPKCGKVLLIKSGKLKCSSCNFIKEVEKIPTWHANVKNITRKKQGGIIVEGSLKKEMNVIEHTCPYCGNNKAILVYYGVTRGDEDPLEIYQCLKCKKFSREGWGYC